MDKENSYTPSIKRLSNDELLLYIENPEEYQEDAVIAAIGELQKRGIKNYKFADTLALFENKLSQNENPLSKIVITPSFSEYKDLPVLFSKRAIRLFSILFSTLFGGILLSINLSRLNKKKEIFFVISFSLLFSYGIGLLVTYFPEYSTVIALSMNLLGLIILEGLFWNRMIGNEIKYSKQPIWMALGIGLLMVAFLLWNMMK